MTRRGTLDWIEHSLITSSHFVISSFSDESGEGLMYEATTEMV